MPIGYFYLAWVDEGTAFDDAVHNVMDEFVFDIKGTQAEGEFLQIDCEIKNPRIGLLNAGRKQWAWLSYHASNDVITPLLYGRVIGIPSNFFAEACTISFLAKPVDHLAQKTALAETLKVEPFWDPIFLTKEAAEDPDTVLESRAAHWHIDPITHEVTISSVFNGEDGTIELTADDYFDDSMSITLEQIPATTIVINASVDWDQSFVVPGIDVMPAFYNLFRSDTDGSNTIFSDTLIKSFTMKGLISGWPKDGANIGGGWIVQQGVLENVGFTMAPATELPHWLTANPEDPFHDLPLPAPLPVGSIFFAPKISGKFWSGETAGFNTNYEQVFLPLGYGKPTLRISCDQLREYRELLTITLRTSVQSIVTEPGEEDRIVMEINGNKVSDLIGDEVPIGDTRRRKFFATERGIKGIKYLLCVARAQMAIKARSVHIEVDVPFETGLEATLRKNLLIHNPRLPGGQAVGKIINKAYSVNGDNGQAIATLTMACLIGKGEVGYTASVGTPTYGSTDYMGPDYQQFNSVVSLIDPTVNELAFTVDEYVPQDDGLDPMFLKLRDIVVDASIQNQSADQRAQITGAGIIGTIVDNAQVSEILQDFYTQFSVELKNAKAGPFESFVTITVEDLVLPRQINLEAA